ncbi:hypothetical protein ACFV2Q_09005 [Streptomyces sp. NPDC059650]
MDWPHVLLWICLAYVALRIALLEIRSRHWPRGTGEDDDDRVADEV